MLKVAILGTGTMARTHAPGYKTIEGVEIVYFADELPGPLESVAASFGAKAVKSYDQVINDPAIDIIDICLPTPFHKEYAIKALKAGKHVFCEKPVARTLEDAYEVKKAVEASDKKFMVGHVVRFFPDFSHMKHLIESGQIGTPAIARTCRLAPMPHGIREWYENMQMSGGCVLDLIIHDFDYLNWFFGKPKRVFARGLFGQKLAEPMDYAQVMIRYENGVIAHVEGSWAEPSGFTVKCEVSGSEGIIESTNSESPLQVNLKQTDTSKPAVAVPESPLSESPYTTEIRHFIECIQENKTPRVTVDDGIYAIKVGLAALESIQTGQPVNID